jgi:hypothetical protein
VPVESWNPVNNVEATGPPRSPTTVVNVPSLVTPAPLPAPKLAATPRATGSVAWQVPVVNVQILLTARAFPATSFAPLAPPLIVAM